MPQLSPLQIAALRTFEWFYDPTVRRQGRTTILAISLIRTALRYPGHRLPMHDFLPSHDVDRELIRVITSIISDEGLNGCRFDMLTRHRNPVLCFDLRSPSRPGWLPRGWSAGPNPPTPLNAPLTVPTTPPPQAPSLRDDPPTLSLWERLEGDP